MVKRTRYPDEWQEIRLPIDSKSKKVYRCVHRDMNTVTLRYHEPK